MKAAFVSLFLAVIFACAVPIHAQQPILPGMNPSACGSGRPNFSIKEDASAPAVTQAPDGKALIHVIEQMPPVGLISTKVAVGVDGSWVGETKPQTYVSFTVDPGVHHICANYQGDAAVGEEGKTILRRLNVEAGHTYYLLYRGIFSRDSGEVAFFDEVDEDEGGYLLQTSQHVISTTKK
ncbi:MAG TPA: hypothetical protein VGU25_01225 [Acidobacteriaceae bacterium]|nr:hypothetical protein [Acidobacteriaceae bacterium]